MTLVVWLFAIASGIVNACLLETHEAHIHGVSAKQDRSALFSAVVDHDSHRPADHGDKTNVVNAPCLKFCDDETNTPVKQPSPINLPDVIVVTPIAAIWMPPTLVTMRRHRAQALRSLAAGPPVRLRYSRLAL